MQNCIIQTRINTPPIKDAMKRTRLHHAHAGMFQKVLSHPHPRIGTVLHQNPTCLRVLLVTNVDGASLRLSVRCDGWESLANVQVTLQVDG